MRTLLFCFVLTCTQAFGNHAQNIYKHLLRVNPEWKHHQVPEALLNGFNEPRTEQESVSLHLQVTEKYLRQKNQGNPQKLKLLDALKAYHQRGLFPVNSKYYGRRPCFIDEYNTVCAAGNLMYATGDTLLAQNIAANERYDFIRDITTPGVKAWIKKTGFTLDELALVQPGYDAPVPQPTCGKMVLQRDGFSSDSIRYIGECKNGVLHGWWTVYNSNGGLREKGRFENGKRTGQWVNYWYYPDPEGNMHGRPLRKAMVNYVDGKEEGLFLFTDATGTDIYGKGYYKQGEKTGKWTYTPFWEGERYEETYTWVDSCQCYSYTYSDSERDAKGFVWHNMKINHWTFAYKDSSYTWDHFYTRSDTAGYDEEDYHTNIRCGKKQGKFVGTSINKRTKERLTEFNTYVDDVLEGPFMLRRHGDPEDRNYFDKGITVLMFGSHHNGLRDGAYYETTNGDITVKGQYEQGHKTGVWEELDKGRVRKQQTWANGLQQGQEIIYVQEKNGKNIARKVYAYANGVLEGTYYEYNSDGTVYATGTYTNGSLNGKCMTYFDSGKVQYEKQYENGKETLSKIFLGSGELYSTTWHDKTEMRKKVALLGIQLQLKNLPAEEDRESLTETNEFDGVRTYTLNTARGSYYSFSIDAHGNLLQKH